MKNNKNKKQMVFGFFEYGRNFIIKIFEVEGGKNVL